METKPIFINKYASVIYRLGQTYFDAQLSPWEIGCGQQFFLLRIQEQPGISLMELAQTGYYDKGTATRAVKRLEELGYIRREIDDHDKRIHRLFVAEAGQPVLRATHQALDQWRDILTGGFSQQERKTANQLMERMSENAYGYMKQFGKKEREWK